MKKETSPLLVKASQAAAMLGISQRFLWTLTQSGELPRVQIGKSVRYEVADLRQFIAQRRRQNK